LVSILLGGISLQTPDRVSQAPPAPSGSVFPLFATRDEALKHEETARPFLLVFQESVRGLTVGAQVDLQGVTVGEVTKIGVVPNAQCSQFSIPVEILLYPGQISVQSGKSQSNQPSYRELLDALVAHGFRAEIKSGSLLTGQLYISLDFAEKARPARILWSSKPPQFPTVPGSMGQLQKNLMQIIQRIEKLPLGELAGDTGKSLRSLDATLKSADKLLKNMDGSLVPEARSVLVETRRSIDDLGKTLREARSTLGSANQTLSSDGPLQVNMRETLVEVSRAAQSLRVLSDYLEQHPESIIRGKREDKQ
jgi:paraquat-inducible protein B